MGLVKEQEYKELEKYKKFIVEAADLYDWEPSLIAAIMSRESRMGLLLDEDLLGDNGHGHGLMQLDDRSFGEWLEENDWQDPRVNIQMGVRVLQDKYEFLQGKIDEDWLDQAAVAAYNCGEGNILKVFQNGEDIDNRTASKNYSADVFARKAEIDENVDFGEESDQLPVVETGNLETPVPPKKIMQRDLIKLYGDPNSDKAKSYLKLIDLSEFDIGHVTGYLNKKKFYGHRDLEVPLKQALTCLQSRGIIKELKTWDGCYNVRRMTGSNSYSVHSWGLAIDLNASENGYGEEPSFSNKFVQCFKNAGFTWGGDWNTPDGMHFQIPKI